MPICAKSQEISGPPNFSGLPGGGNPLEKCRILGFRILKVWARRRRAKGPILSGLPPSRRPTQPAPETIADHRRTSPWSRSAPLPMRYPDLRPSIDLS
jgi:hypothetical protein